MVDWVINSNTIYSKAPNLTTLLWIDGDSIFTNFNISIASRIEYSSIIAKRPLKGNAIDQLLITKENTLPSSFTSPTQMDIIISRENTRRFNAGVFILRINEWRFFLFFFCFYPQKKGGEK